MFVGRIDPLKDLHTLIRAFGEVRRTLPDARLRVFGPVPKANEAYHASCVELVAELGLTGSAVFEGRVPQQVDAYHAGHVVALTSVSEGFPFTVVEAMSTGRPPVCTDVGGVSEAVADAGLVVPPRDHEAVAKACVRLLTDSGLRRTLGGRARQRVVDHFTVQRWNDSYLARYAELTTGSPAMILDELVERIAGLLPDPVDELQVAALLESQGVTDQIAVDRYGRADVFALAREVFERLPRASVETPADSGRTTWLHAVRGPLYLAPTTVFPAVAAVLGGPAAVRAMVVATAVSWVWGSGTSAVAHQLLGHGAGATAGRTLRLLGAAGVVVTVAAAIPVLGWSAALFVLALASLQLAIGVLLFHRKEIVLAAAVVPAGAGGVLHLASGAVEVVLVLGGATVLLAVGGAWYSGRGGKDPGGTRMPAARTLLSAAVPSVVYAAVCAALLLHTNARYVLDALDLALAAAPLVLGMGVVEWRAHRFFELASDELHRCALPRDFRAAIWRGLLKELGVCLVALGSAALVLLLALRWTGVLTSSGALLIDGHVLLGGAFFLGFVLVRTGGAVLAPLIVSGVLLGNVAATGLSADPAPVFLLTGAALSVFLLVALHRSVGQVRHYR